MRASLNRLKYIDLSINYCVCDHILICMTNYGVFYNSVDDFMINGCGDLLYPLKWSAHFMFFYFLQMSVYDSGVSVLMPGDAIPTFIAHPAPAPCCPERNSWPSHQQNTLPCSTSTTRPVSNEVWEIWTWPSYAFSVKNRLFLGFAFLPFLPGGVL